MPDRPEDCSITELWELFEKALGDLCAAWARGHFAPLLEADVAAYLYYLLVSYFGGNASWLHLETRMVSSNQNRKPDLIIGQVLSTEDQKERFLANREPIPDKFQKIFKSTKSGFRPAVDAKLILEFKFLRGTKGLISAEDDMAKLGGLAQDFPEGRASVLFDDKGILTDERREGIVTAIGPKDPRLRIYVCEKRRSGDASWTLL
jgi:hypothetical protein